MIKSDLCIVVPLGVSSPNTPIKKYLLDCINSLKNQKTKFSYDVIFACDDNVSDEIKEILLNSGFKIRWFEPYYFMRKGGIWKKIHTVWQSENSKYISFCHYDDMWSENKVESQIQFMIDNNLEMCWSKVQVINENNQICSNDICNLEVFNSRTIHSSSYAFCHSSIMQKDLFLSSGILDYVDIGSALYERLQFIFSHKLNGKKDNNSCFFHRVHTDSVTNNFNSEKSYMTEQRKEANYSLQEVLEDANKIPLDKIIKSILNENNLS
ncbi:MAG: hypothetical protein RIR47_114 [Bacteroidota bacterium]|jgi:hypothetical protein